MNIETADGVKWAALEPCADWLFFYYFELDMNFCIKYKIYFYTAVTIDNYE